MVVDLLAQGIEVPPLSSRQIAAEADANRDRNFVLIIDELSLPLAPIIVHQLIAVVERAA